MHAVALVPGFLGFGHFGHFSYFADRFVAGLRAAIEAKTGHTVVVVPIEVPPVGPLSERQRKLLDELARLDRTEDGPFEWHLVGHSTGGLDAAFLARTTRLTRRSGQASSFSDEPLHVERLRSITTVSAPHYGTGLARSPIAGLTRGGAPWRERARGLAAIPGAVRAVLQRDALLERLRFIAGAASGDAAFVVHALFDDALARDLDPAVATALTDRADNRRAVPIFSIATRAPRPVDDEPPPRDHLFEYLWEATRAGAIGAPPGPGVDVSSEVTRVEHTPRSIPDGAIADGDNDGVVNTNRQVFGDFAGIVAADHADVLGRYRRCDPLRPDEVLDPGLLTSGAWFGDDEFFALLDLVARGIATEIPQARR